MAALCYDVVVVGAGPAGSSAARVAAANGCAVLLLDKRAEVGRPVQCAEYAPRLVLRESSLPSACVAHATLSMRTFLPGGGSRVMRAPGFILHRALFDKHLAVEAARAGTEVMLRATALERSEEGLVVRTGGREREIKTKIIVGADGPHSTVGRWIGQRNGQYIAAAQSELVLPASATETEVYFAPQYVGGYAWLFPKGNTANAGVGIDANIAGGGLAGVLEGFVDHLRATGRIKRAAAVAHTGGEIPVGGLLKGWAENVLLAGDAGGCVHPMTGAGIYFALVSGRLAGTVAAASVRAGDRGVLARYARLRDEAIGGAIGRALEARRRLVAGWSEDPATLDGVLRQSWIAFESYGGDRMRGADEH